ncbi:polyprenyl synthetase family protein [Crocinitomicaceae bacterium]|nr:polyprenyl synthetase family protein [Crocinitomicaceae bacterium]
MNALKAYTEFIDAELEKVHFPSGPAELYDPLRYFMSLGGKRIRPILTILGSEMFGSSKKAAIPQALSMELFHNFSLIHDDIMDDAPVRRNQATVHEKWNSNIAILSGDVLLIKAYQLLSEIAPDVLPRALDLFSTTAVDVCEGQQMDMNFESRLDVTISEYIEMIRLKTSVLLGASLKMGALVAGASEKDQQHIYNFGQNIGIAFQIQDDILDLYADPEKFGKQVGGDVIANKKTLLYLTAVSKVTMEQKEILKQLHSEGDIALKIGRTKELFDHLQVRETCAQMMKSYYDKAMESLNSIDVDETHKSTLISLAEFLIQRDN